MFFGEILLVLSLMYQLRLTHRWRPQAEAMAAEAARAKEEAQRRVVEAKQMKMQASLAGSETRPKTVNVDGSPADARTAALAEKIAASQAEAQAEEEAREARLRQAQAAREERLKVRLSDGCRSPAAANPDNCGVAYLRPFELPMACVHPYSLPPIIHFSCFRRRRLTGSDEPRRLTPWRRQQRANHLRLHRNLRRRPSCPPALNLRRARLRA